MHFGTDGRCTRIPSEHNANLTERHRIQMYATREDYGLIWVLMAGSDAPFAQMPTWHDHSYQRVLPPSLDIAASAGRQVEGFIDVAHFAWIHHEAFADRDNPVVPTYKAELTAYGMHAEYVSSVSNFPKQIQHRAPEGFPWNTLARELRKLDALTPIVIVTRDGGEFYSKPALSNAFQSGQVHDLVLPYVMPIMLQARALAQTLAGQPTPVAYPAMPVTIKTSVLPTVVASPLDDQGRWSTELLSRCDKRFANVRSLCHDRQSRIQGFVLMGAATQEKAELLKALPNWR